MFTRAVVPRGIFTAWKPMKVYQIALKKGLRLPFKAADELHPDTLERSETKPEAPGAAKPAASPLALRGGLPASRPRQGDRGAHLGRGGLALQRQSALRSRHRARAHERGVRA